jgi:acetyl-CoA carboxylase biotin carboxyl carrier protein
VAQENDNPRPFDVRTIRYLVRLMRRNDLSELDLAEGEQRIRIRRGPRIVGSAPVPMVPAAVPAPAPVAVPTPSAPPAEKAAAAAPAKKLLEIKSPAVGTFYTQKDPNAPPYVSVGSRVSVGTVVCLIEAMKVFNEIQSEVTGVITEICVNNKDFVEYNTVLFRVDPAG